MIALADATAGISLSSNCYCFFGAAKCTFMTFVLQNNRTRVCRCLKLSARFVRNLGPENVALGRTQASLPGWNSRSCPQPVTNIPNCFFLLLSYIGEASKAICWKSCEFRLPPPMVGPSSQLFPHIAFDASPRQLNQRIVHIAYCLTMIFYVCFIPKQIKVENSLSKRQNTLKIPRFKI